MTVTTTSSKITSLGNGVTTAFSFPFIGVSAADLIVSITSSTGVTTLLVPTQYTVFINPPPVGGLWGIGGTVTYPLSGSPLATGYTLTIVRDVPYTQEISIANQGAFYPQAVEQALDKLELEIQQVATLAEYSLKFPLTDPIPPVDLPNAAERAGGVLGFDTNGQPIITPNHDVTITINTVTQNKDSFSQPALAYLNTPPAGSGTNRYLVGITPTGAWAGKAGLIAEWDATAAAWTFSPAPKQGQVVYNSGAGINYIYRNSWWNKVVSDVPNALYQDFGDVPNGTLLNGFILASGHVCRPTGTGGTATVINNGRVEATGNLYNVINYPYKNIRMAFKYAWKSGFTSSGYVVTMAAGRYVSGTIITKMNHMDYQYQNYGELSIWGGPRRTIVGGSPLPYLAWQDTQYHYRALDSNYPLHIAGDIQYAEMYINGNTVLSHNDYGRFTDSYTDSMVSGSLGDDDSGNLGYLYFQQGTTDDANLPYVYMILAEPVPPTVDLPNPEFMPSSAGLPQVIQKVLTFGGGAQEVCRFTAQDFTSYTFEVNTNIQSQGPTPGYSLATQKWLVNVGVYLGNVTVSTQALDSQLKTSLNSGVVDVSNTFTVSTSGLNIIFKGTPTQAGSDPGTTNLVTYSINNIIGSAAFS